MSEEDQSFDIQNNQQRIQQAQVKIQNWQKTKGNNVEIPFKQEQYPDQDKPSQDEDDDIHIEMVDLSSKKNNLQQDSDPDKLRESLSGKHVLNEQYKQFYGGEDELAASHFGRQKHPSGKTAPHQSQGMGTIVGVYLPCLQNIMSVVIFLRMSSIVGEAGIGQSLLLLFLTTSTTFLTVLSMSAIATNGKIRTGGVYYLISRSLGPSSGGAIGILYYLATTFSSGMSIIGAVEALEVSTHLHLGPREFSERFFSLIFLGILLALSLFGTRIVSKAGLAMILFVFISILSVLIGLFSSKKRQIDIQETLPGIDGLSGHNFVANWKSQYKENNFYLLLAIFFNACTGILTGTNVSGELRNPLYSIPKGTIAAHLSSTTLYFLMIILFGCAGSRTSLMDLDVIVAAVVAWPSKWVVYIGIILSSLGAALNNISNSPQIIKAIADDDMLPKIFDFLKGDIRKSIFFSGALIVVTIGFGSLNHVAPLVTIFYLLCYGGVNISCFLLDWLGSPNWRPKWKYYHKVTAFFGAVLCIACMIIISWWASLASICGALVIFAYFDRRSQEKNWGDGVEGMRAERARNALLKIDKNKKHVKNWRPHYLALGYINEKGKISAPGIFKLLHQLRKGTGLAIYGCVVKGDYTTEAYEESRNKEKELDLFMKKNKYNVFSKVIVSQNIENGMVYLIQSSGLGGLEPNTILLSWPSQWEDDELKSKRFVNLIRHSHTVGHLLTILKSQKEFDNDLKHTGYMDIWSFNFEKGMLLLIAQILLKNSHWKRCTVRLFVVTSLPTAESETMKRVTREYLDRYRLLNDNIFIEVVHLDPRITQQFTYNLNETLEKKEKIFKEAMSNKSDKDFEYGTLPSLMKLKALQEKEIKAAHDVQHYKRGEDGNLEITFEQDVDENLENAREINRMMLLRSKEETSIIITNLPPIIKGQSAKDYLQFCSVMTEGVNRLLFIQNSSKEVLTQYS